MSTDEQVEAEEQHTRLGLVAREYGEQVIALKVCDGASMGVAVQMTGDVAAARKTAEAKRVELVGPLNDHVRKINAMFRPIIERLDALTATLKEKMSAYREEQVQQAEAAQRKIEEAQRAADAERERAERAREEAEWRLDSASTATAPAAAKNLEMAARAVQAAVAARQEASAIVPAPQPTTVYSEGGASVSFRKRWTFEIENDTKIPIGYMMPNEAAIRKAITAGVRDIPGIRIFEQSTPVVR